MKYRKILELFEFVRIYTLESWQTLNIVTIPSEGSYHQSLSHCLSEERKKQKKLYNFLWFLLQNLLISSGLQLQWETKICDWYQPSTNLETLIKNKTIKLEVLITFPLNNILNNLQPLKPAMVLIKENILLNISM